MLDDCRDRALLDAICDEKGREPCEAYRLVWWTSETASVANSKFGFYRIERKETFGHAIDHFDLTGPDGANLGTFLDPEDAQKSAQKDYDERAKPKARLVDLKADVNRARRCLERAILEQLQECYSRSQDFCFRSIKSLETDGVGLELARGLLRDMRANDLVTFEKGLFTDDGETAGSGYAITPTGRDYLRALELDGA